jgi:hypothetical protein
MSVDATKWVWTLTKKEVTTTEKLLLLSIADRCGEKGECWPSIKRLMTDTLMDRKTILKIRQSLIDKNILSYTGDFMGRTKSVPIMRLNYIQVDPKKPSKSYPQSSPKNGTASKISSPKNGTGSSPKIGTPKQSQNWDTEPNNRNLKEEPKNNYKDPVIISSFLLTEKTPEEICVVIRDRASSKGLEELPNDIVQQILFFVMTTTKYEPLKAINIAIKKHSEGAWRIPNGYKGVTVQSIREEEEAQQREKRKRYEEEAQAFRDVTKEAANREVAKSHLAGLLSSLKPNYNPAVRMTDE